jgi:hypothetical protein
VDTDILAAGACGPPWFLEHAFRTGARPGLACRIRRGVGSHRSLRRFRLVAERNEVFDGFLNRCRWVEVFDVWRPNLPDEADNHLIELGVAALADAIVTRNLRDVSRGELKFPSLRVLTPEQCLEVFPCPR